MHKNEIWHNSVAEQQKSLYMCAELLQLVKVCQNTRSVLQGNMVTKQCGYLPLPLEFKWTCTRVTNDICSKEHLKICRHWKAEPCEYRCIQTAIWMDFSKIFIGGLPQCGGSNHHKFHGMWQIFTPQQWRQSYCDGSAQGIAGQQPSGHVPAHVPHNSTGEVFSCPQMDHCSNAFTVTSHNSV
jgi:hypothetical protein